MGEYLLVNKNSLTRVADAVRDKTGSQSELTFPDEFISSIESLYQTPTTEELSATFVDGDTVATDHVEVGHNSGGTNKDAIWSFKPNINGSVVKFDFSWDNDSDGTNHGWSGEFEYAFMVTTDSTPGQMVATSADRCVIVLNGSDGKGTVIMNYSVSADTPYYIRANLDGATLSSLKAFSQNGNKVKVYV